jgi:hypothetical protein
VDSRRFALTLALACIVSIYCYIPCDCQISHPSVSLLSRQNAEIGHLVLRATAPGKSTSETAGCGHWCLAPARGRCRKVQLRLCLSLSLQFQPRHDCDITFLLRFHNRTRLRSFYLSFILHSAQAHKRTSSLLYPHRCCLLDSQALK